MKCCLIYYRRESYFRSISYEKILFARKVFLKFIPPILKSHGKTVALHCLHKTDIQNKFLTVDFTRNIPYMQKRILLVAHLLCNPCTYNATLET